MKRLIILPTDLGGLATAACLTLAAHFLLVRPALRAREASDSLAMTVAERTRELATLRSDVDALGAEHGRLEEDMHSVRRLEPRSRLNQRLGALGALAESHGLEILELRRVGESPASDICTVSLRLSGQGAFKDIVRCLHDLHVGEQHVAIDGIDMSGNPQGGGPVRITLDLRWHAAPATTAAQPGLDSG